MTKAIDHNTCGVLAVALGKVTYSPHNTIEDANRFYDELCNAGLNPEMPRTLFTHAAEKGAFVASDRLRPRSMKP